MNKEDKDLLLKDLCARLPFADDTICVRPYLRPMSSMTEEELKEFQKFRDISPLDWLTVAHDGFFQSTLI